MTENFLKNSKISLMSFSTVSTSTCHLKGKPKTHFLKKHATSNDLKRLGNLLDANNERFENNNLYGKGSYRLSNKRSPSYDISRDELERMVKKEIFQGAKRLLR